MARKSDTLHRTSESRSHPSTTSSEAGTGGKFRIDKRRILELYDDGYTVHEISESLGPVHCTEIAKIISEEIKDEAERCA